MDFVDGIKAYLLSNGLNIVYALAILVVGIVVATATLVVIMIATAVMSNLVDAHLK